MIHKLILFKGDVETLEYFSEQMRETFIELGYQVFVFDYKDQERSLKKLRKFVDKGRTAAVTFNFIGIDDHELFSEKNGELFFDIFDVLCINIMVDHPFYYHPILMQMPKHTIQLCIDRQHLAYVNRFFPQIAHTGFLPLAGTKVWKEGRADIPYEEREMDIVFTGNYASPSNFEKHITRIDEEYEAFYYGIIHELIEYPDTPMDWCMEKHLLRELEDEKTEENLRDAMATMQFIDLYVRMYFRGEAVKALVDAGLKVHVFGAGWDKLSVNNPENLIIGEACSSEECLEHIANAKISLNVMPWFKDGAHDRIFNTMMNGAVALSDGSTYLEEVFADATHLVYYNLASIERLPELAKEILANPEKAKRMIVEGSKKTSREHTWKQRAEAIHAWICEYS